jgi:hypothetical protein
MATKVPPTPPKKPETLFQKLDKAMRQNKVESYTKDAYAWLIKESGKLRGSSTRQRVMKEEKKKALKGDPSQIHVGSMVLYAYDPKLKETLPYYDMYPLIFIIDVEKDRFHGINLHYLPNKLRAILFDKLLTIANNSRADNTTKLRISYNILKAASKFKLFKPCFKEYLFSHVKSKMIKISPQDWQYAVFLPVQQFKKASASKVWSDSVIEANKPKAP